MTLCDCLLHALIVRQSCCHILLFDVNLTCTLDNMIVRVNDVVLGQCSHDEAVGALRLAGGKITLTLARMQLPDASQLLEGEVK